MVAKVTRSEAFLGMGNRVSSCAPNAACLRTGAGSSSALGAVASAPSCGCAAATGPASSPNPPHPAHSAPHRTQPCGPPGLLHGRALVVQLLRGGVLTDALHEGRVSGQADGARLCKRQQRALGRVGTCAVSALVQCCWRARPPHAMCTMRMEHGRAWCDVGIRTCSGGLSGPCYQGPLAPAPSPARAHRPSGTPASRARCPG